MGKRADHNIRISTAAVADLDELWLYVAEDNPVAADRYVDELTARCQLLGRNPEIGRPRDELADGLRSFSYRNHLIGLTVTWTERSTGWDIDLEIDLDQVRAIQLGEDERSPVYAKIEDIANLLHAGPIRLKTAKVGGGW